jgi:hypothetical protein
MHNYDNKPYIIIVVHGLKMINKLSRYLFALVVLLSAQHVWAGKIAVLNNSTYPIICLFGASHHSHITTILHTARTVILPGESADLDLSDEKKSSIYAYRVLPERFSVLLGEVKDKIMVGGQLDVSQLNLGNLLSTDFQQNLPQKALKKLITLFVVKDSPVRYLEIKPAELLQDNTIVIQNQEDSDTIAPLMLGSHDDIKERSEKTDNAQTHTLTINNNSKFPVLMAYGNKTWGSGFSEKGRLDLRFGWWKSSKKGIIDPTEQTEIHIDGKADTYLLFYRISAEEELKNAAYIAKKITAGTAKKAVLNTILPGSSLVNDLSKLFALYSVYQEAKKNLPFTTTAIDQEQLSNCSSITINTSENQTTVVCNLN